MTVQEKLSYIRIRFLASYMIGARGRIHSPHEKSKHIQKGYAITFVCWVYSYGKFHSFPFYSFFHRTTNSQLK